MGWEEPLSFEERAQAAVAVDVVALYWDGSTVSLPLVRRDLEPFEGLWALPGGFLGDRETLDEAAARALSGEAGLPTGTLRRGPLFDAPNRDPRGRVLGTPHVTLVRRPGEEAQAGGEVSDAGVFPLDALPAELAFDHAEMIAAMRAFAANELERGRLGEDLSPEEREMVAGLLLPSDAV